MLSFFSGVLGMGGESGRISAEDLKAMLESGEKVTVIDVRTSSEFSSGHIPGSVSIPLDTLPGARVAPGKVVLCCASGVRSVSARKALEARGLKDVVDLKGGLRGWAAAGGKVVAGKRQ